MSDSQKQRRRKMPKNAPTETVQANVPGWPDRDMVEAAMGIIANVDHGEWNQREEWLNAAKAWMEAYHRHIEAKSHEPERA